MNEATRPDKGQGAPSKRLLYEIWHSETRNLIGVYYTEPEVRAMLNEAFTVHGPAALEGIAIDLADEDGNGQTVAHGFGEVFAFMEGSHEAEGVAE